MTTKNGTIYLIGSGPGDEGLITVKGLALIREADVIVGDVRGQAPLLQEARPDAERYDVGCRASESDYTPAEINDLLIELAQAGKTVVRLWPGDPFIYGRAAQELAAARRAGIPVEVVPGVTSALAAPAYAGVPLTHWEYGVSFAVVTGLESKNPRVRPDWSALARMETLIILMPLNNLQEIVTRLLAAGRKAHTPAVVVQQGTLPQQKQVSATLGTLAQVVEKEGITSPAIVIVGQVAGLAKDLAWFEPDSKPLLGKRVLVTRPPHQAGDFMADLRRLGATPISFPTIAIQPVADIGPLDEAIRRIAAWQQAMSEWTNERMEANEDSTPSQPTPARERSENESLPSGGGDRGGARSAQPNHPISHPPYHWLVLTSTNGVEAFWQRLQALGFDSRILAHLQIAAIGPATAEALTRRSITPDLVPAEYTAEGVLAAFAARGDVAGQRFLLARSDLARKTLAEGLAERGAAVDEIASYRTVPVDEGPLPPATDIVTFTSSSTVQGYVNCLEGRDPAQFLAGRQVVCIGPITAGTAKTLGVPVSSVADEYTIEGLLTTLKEVNDDNRQANFES